MTSLSSEIKTVRDFLRGKINISALSLDHVIQYFDYSLATGHSEDIHSLGEKIYQAYYQSSIKPSTYISQMQAAFLFEALVQNVTLALSPVFHCDGLPPDIAFIVFPSKNKGKKNRINFCQLSPNHQNFIFCSTQGENYYPDLVRYKLYYNAPIRRYTPTSQTYEGTLKFLQRNGTNWDNTVDSAAQRLFSMYFEQGYFSLIDCLFGTDLKTPLLCVQRSYQQVLEGRGLKSDIEIQATITTCHYMMHAPLIFARFVEELEKTENIPGLSGAQRAVEKLMKNPKNSKRVEVLCQTAENSSPLNELLTKAVRNLSFTSDIFDMDEDLLAGAPKFRNLYMRAVYSPEISLIPSQNLEGRQSAYNKFGAIPQTLSL